MKKLLLACALLALFSASVYAHHSSAGRYDSSTIMEVEGIITSVHWRNPHAKLTVQVEDSNGIQVEWEVEGASTTTLSRAGLRSAYLNAGDLIRVAGWSPVTERRELFMQNILLPSGEEFVTWPGVTARWSPESRGDFAYWSRSEGDRSEPEWGIFRVWSSSFAFPQLFDLRRLDRNAFPLTDTGLARVEAFESAGENLVSSQGCTPKGMPLIMEQPYPMEFVQDGENIALHIEEYDVIRRIYMNADSAAGQDLPLSPFGYSTGQWQGDTLVVTTNRLNWPLLNQSGAPLSEAVSLVERFTPMEDGSRLDYELVINDPVMYTEPFTRAKQWLYLPGQEVKPYECAE